MSVKLSRFRLDELLILDYEYSSQADYVTHLVSLFLNNNGAELQEIARAHARVGPRLLAEWFIAKLQSPTKMWVDGIGTELSVSAFTRGQIRWHAVCFDLLSE